MDFGPPWMCSRGLDSSISVPELISLRQRNHWLLTLTESLSVYLAALSTSSPSRGSFRRAQPLMTHLIHSMTSGIWQAVAITLSSYTTAGKNITGTHLPSFSGDAGNSLSVVHSSWFVSTATALDARRIGLMQLLSMGKAISCLTMPKVMITSAGRRACFLRLSSATSLPLSTALS